MSILKDFLAASHDQHKKTAIIDGARTCTYQELDQKSDALAQLILNKIGPQQPILLLLEPSIEQIIAILATIKARCYYIPCDVRLAEERLAFILKDSEAQLIISSKTSIFSDPINDCIETWDIQHIIPAEPLLPLPAAFPLPKHTDLAYIIYTSGTTGYPKGVKISHSNLSALFAATRAVFSFSDTDRWAYLHSYGFDFSVWEIWGALTTGATLSLFPYETIISPELLAQELLAQNISVLNQTPSAFYRIQDRLLRNIKAQTQPCLRYIIFGGETLETALIQPWIAFGQQSPYPILVNMYGITEGTVHCTFSLVQENYADHGVKNIIGTPLAGYVFHLSPLDNGEYELLISGPSVCQGYLNRPALEKEKFIEIDNILYFRTGDLVRQVGESFEYIGRADDQVKVRGYRITLGEINHHLGLCGNVQSVVTLPISSAGETQLASFVTLTEHNYDETLPEHQKQIENWKNIYDQLYAHDFKQQNYTFNTQGWNNSLTNQPFAQEVMQEWLQDTLDKISSLKPRSVLEIGCGSGLILFGLLDKIDAYCGIDISHQTINQLRYLTQQHNVDLFASEALHFDAIPELQGKTFDCVIINSVIQYFPSIGYLRALIKKLKRFLSPDANLFFGDIRNYDLLHEYHYFLSRYRAKVQGIAAEHIPEQTYISISQEQELLISPAFFRNQALALLGTDAMGVKLFRKQSTAENELNLFRYDVILKCVPNNEFHKKIVYSDASQDLAHLINTICFDTEILVIPCMDNTLHDLTYDSSLQPPLPNYLVTTIPELQAILAQYPIQCRYMLSTEGSCYFDAVLYKGSLPHIAKSTIVPAQIRYANYPLEMEQDLFAALRKKIPFYAIPKYIHVIDYLPITHHGKIDKNKLLEFHAQQSHLLPLVTQEYDAIANSNLQAQSILVNIWKKVLKLKTVNLDADFFEIGGDSISSLQIVHSCKQAGLQFNIRDLFKHRTIHNLTQMLEVTQTKRACQNIPTSAFGLSHIQDWFLNCHQGAIHEYCQSFILALQPHIDQTLWSEVLNNLFSSRSSFKIRFKQVGAKWQQSFSEQSHAISIDPKTIEISNPNEIIAHIKSTKHLLDIEHGALACAHFFALGAQRLCVLSIHHLVIDSISWKTLLDDICTLYANITQYQQHQPNPEKIHYAEYAAGLNNIPLCFILDDLNFWLAQLGSNFFEPRATHYRNTRQLAQSFSMGNHLIPASDALAIQLAALYLALRTLKKQEIVLTLEKHGREDFIHSNIESSLGWHTSLFPIKLEFGDHLDTQELLEHLKALLVKIPHGGVTFLAAKQQGLLPLPQAVYTSDISFNFLGNFDHIFRDNCILSDVSPVIESFHDIDLSCPFTLQINTCIQDKSLLVYFIYDQSLEEQIAHLSEKFETYLKQIILFQQQSYAYPLTPMQNYLQKFSDFPLQFHQMALKINSAILSKNLEQALLRILNQFDIFKMQFKLDQQYISPGEKKLWVKEHWAKTDAKSALNDVMLADRAQPFHPDTEHLIRLNVIHFEHDEQIILLTYHQYVLDGWALQQFLSLWSTYIIALEQGSESQSLNPTSHDLYLAYLHQLAINNKTNHKIPHFTPEPRLSRSALEIIKQRYGSRQKANTAYGKIIHRLPAEDFAALQSLCSTQKITMGALLITALGYFLADNQIQQVHFNMIEAGRFDGQFDHTIGTLTCIKSISVHCGKHFMQSVYDIGRQLLSLQESGDPIDPLSAGNQDELVISFQNFRKQDDIASHFANREILELVSLETTNTPITIRFVPSQHLEIWVSYQTSNFNELGLQKMCHELDRCLHFLSKTDRSVMRQKS